MSAHSPTAPPASLSASIDSVFSQSGRGPAVWWFPVICCVISMLATALFVERHRREAWRVAEHELAVVATIAAQDYTVISGQFAGAQDGGEQQRNQMRDRIQRLTGKRVVFIEPQDKALIAPVDPMPEKIADPALEEILRMAPGSIFKLRGTGEAGAFMVYTQLLPDVLPAPRMVAVLAPENEVLAGFNALRRNALAACLGFMLIVVTLAWAFSRHLVRRDAFEVVIRDRENALEAQRTRLNETYRIARIGHFYWDLATDALELQGDDSSIARIGHRLLREPARIANRFRRHQNALGIHAVENVAKALALDANEAACRNAHIVEKHFGGVVVDHGGQRADLQALAKARANVEQKHRQPRALAGHLVKRCGACEQQHEIGMQRA